MSDDQILNLIDTALTQVAPRKARTLRPLDPSASLADLGIDSLTAMELVGAVESRLGTTFADEELARVNRLSDLAHLIRGKTEARP
jgi:acyl carrier protein